MLTGNEITDRGARLLSFSNNIKVLEVGFNKISDEGARYLLENTTFTDLNLACTNVTEQIIPDVKANRTLKYLYTGVHSIDSKTDRNDSSQATPYVYRWHISMRNYH
jgi:hypothetical protein